MPPAGRFEMIRELGKGGMGIVFLARDNWLKREVAVKTILRPEGQDEETWRLLVRRLIREAQAAAGLEHDNIVAIHDVIPDEAAPWIVMQYVRGTTLGKAISDRLPLDPSFAVRTLKEVAAALDHAHSRGVVHRDIKPGNIMLADSGRVLVMDFGVAKLVDSSTDLTRGGTVGTLEWMSPEQMNQSKDLDGRSDQFALAAIAYLLLTGNRPFQADSLVALCYQVLNDNPAPASNRNAHLPKNVDDVLERALKKDPQERFETCGAFIADLEVAIRGAADAAVQPSPAPPDETVVLPSPGEPGPRASGVAPECGAVKTNAADGQKYVWIPPGTFLMGAPAGAESDEDERPSREVTITKGFWMGQTPVTLGAYRKYAQTTGRSMPPDEDFLGRKANAALGDDRLPVVLVSWDDACAYAAWAGLKLPTEAQWEYAARGGSAAATYGNLEDIAWYSGNSTGPRPVALKRANAFGLFDALGNVWEWTADWYGEDFYQIAEPQDPGGPAEGVFRVVRGGAWFNDARMVRVCKRYTRKPGGRYNTVGFRCLTV